MGTITDKAYDADQEARREQDISKPSFLKSASESRLTTDANIEKLKLRERTNIAAEISEGILNGRYFINRSSIYEENGDWLQAKGYKVDRISDGEDSYVSIAW